MKEAEEMFVRVRALAGKEKAWGLEHTSTLDTVNNLGLLYKAQGKTKEAEEMFVRALAGKEKAWGAEHTSTLETVNNLETRKPVLGDHPDSISAVHKLEGSGHICVVANFIPRLSGLQFVLVNLS